MDFCFAFSRGFFKISLLPSLVFACGKSAKRDVGTSVDAPVQELPPVETALQNLGKRLPSGKRSW